MYRHYKSTELNNLNILMVLLRLVHFWTSQLNFFRLEVGHFCPNKLWALWWILRHRTTPNFHFILVMYAIHILFLKYLFIDTYKATHSHCDYNRRCSIIGLYYSCKLNFFFLNSRQRTSQDLNPDLWDTKRLNLNLI